MTTPEEIQSQYAPSTEPADIATREEVDKLKAQWLASGGDFDIVPDTRFDTYAAELREFEKAENERWEQKRKERAARWVAQFKLEYCYQLNLMEINRLVDAGFGFAIISTVVVPRTVEYGGSLELERTEHNIIYTVQINGMPIPV